MDLLALGSSLGTPPQKTTKNKKKNETTQNNTKTPETRKSQPQADEINTHNPHNQ
jgi:hypothetical protein